MERIDKKIDCPIILSPSHFATFAGVAELWNVSHPEAAHDLVLRSAASEEVALAMAPYFKKGLCMGNRAFIGHQKIPSYKGELGDLRGGTRIHVKLTYEDWLLVSPYQDAMGCPRNHALQLLVIHGLRVITRGVTVYGVI